MMFVRDDIVNDLNLKIPETWDDIIEIIPDLQSNHLQFFLPVNEEGATALNPIFVSLLYQYGGELYVNDNKESGLSSEAAMLAFEHWTEFYTLYSFPRSANFLNRSRSGEMPMGIAYYDAYNTLSVFAPELRGKWSFYPIPGLRKVDPITNEEYIDRTGTAVGSGVVLMKQNAIRSEQKRNDSWEFMKWWTSTDVQVRFGREMEGILGAAARHTSANMAALEQLAWPVKDYEKLSAQWETIQTMPQVAGSYISGREVENAFRQTINNNVNARETLYDYVLLINREIERKRQEFGLPIA
jgi:ABC-type glycerol-3-phosphate transport system substrate-binding protein